MITALIIAWIGNLVDTVSTLYLSGLGFVEANPIMASLLSHPLLFASAKIVVMTMVLWYLWMNRAYRKARITAWIAAGLYILVSVYYLIFFTVLLPVL